MASIYADGDKSHPIVLQQYEEILAGIRLERETRSLSYKEMVRTPNARKRLSLALSVAVISMLAGNNIVSYYLGDMLSGAGINNTKVQLQIVSRRRIRGHTIPSSRVSLLTILS